MTTDTGKIDTTEAVWRDLFFKACTALWGERWQAAAAKEFWINERTIRRVVAGAPVPAYMFRDLRRLLNDRNGELREIDEALARLLAGDEPARKATEAPAINVDLIRRRLQDNLVANGDEDMAEFLLRVLGHDQLADDVGNAMRDYKFYQRRAADEDLAHQLMEEAREAMFVLFREVRILLDMRADEL